MKNILHQVARKMFLYNPKTGKLISFRRPTYYSFVPFFIIGLGSLIWFLVRVIPKPSRATYPCMKAAMPLAFSFVTCIISMTASVLFFRKAIAHFRINRYKYAFLFLAFGIIVSAGTLIYQSVPSFAGEHGPVTLFTDPLGPNAPIGSAKGVLPGRVVWVYDPDATNENCTNCCANSGFTDAYWLEKNTDQAVVDNMFSDGILSLTGKSTHAEAWDAIFRYFNINHGKGDIGYVSGETIFIKINAVTAYGGLRWSDGEMTSGNPIEFDTSPQAIMALLKQLVNEAHVPQDKIYIGDPIADIYNYMVDKFSAEFPDIRYCSKRTITGRTKITAGAEAGIFYSDKGIVMDDTIVLKGKHNFFTEMMEADYLLNVPAMKGHRWGGVTMFAKNHFGSNITDGSYQLHKGLMKPGETDPVREGYYLYRVMVDLMASKYLGGNTLLYYMDALWSTSYEHQKPQKFQSAPFNNDWCSSLLFSLDPVAIESVGLDILQKEFTEEDMGANPPRYTFVQWDGVDDYLHQAASSRWWPEGIMYDPDNTGSPIDSLGVHEHWNNTTDMQYSRNLGTGEGIELIKIFSNATSIEENASDYSFEVFPNPATSVTNIRFHLEQDVPVRIDIYSIDGKQVQTLVNDPLKEGDHSIKWIPGNYRGIYIIKLIIKGGPVPEMYITKIEVL